jgi:rsbT co-antagonist protein RsbR
MAGDEDTVSREKTHEEPVSEIPTPIVEVWEGIAMIPVVGVLDSFRAKHLTESLLEYVAKHRVDVVILSIGGISAIDTKTANHVLRTIQAVKLMGSEVIMTGMRPDVAASLVSLGVDMSGIITRSTLHQGLEYSFSKLGWKVSRLSSS